MPRPWSQIPLVWAALGTRGYKSSAGDPNVQSKAEATGWRAPPADYIRGSEQE